MKRRFVPPKKATRKLSAKTDIACYRYQDDRGQLVFPLVLTYDLSREPGTGGIRHDSTGESDGVTSTKYVLSHKAARALYSALGQVLRQ